MKTHEEMLQKKLSVILEKVRDNLDAWFENRDTQNQTFAQLFKLIERVKNPDIKQDFICIVLRDISEKVNEVIQSATDQNKQEVMKKLAHLMKELEVPFQRLNNDKMETGETIVYSDADEIKLAVKQFQDHSPSPSPAPAKRSWQSADIKKARPIASTAMIGKKVTLQSASAGKKENHAPAGNRDVRRVSGAEWDDRAEEDKKAESSRPEPARRPRR